jgi:flagellar basal-body rod protein FlgB
MVSKLDQTLGFYEDALRLRAQRQQVLASNIANVDTPNYKAREMDFAKAMQAAKSGAANAQPAPVAMAVTQAGHMAATSTPSLQNSGFVSLRKATQNNLDGNTVDMDIERNAFAENALQYEASVTLVHDNIKGILNVLQPGS